MVSTFDGDLNLSKGLKAAQELVRQRLRFKKGEWVPEQDRRQNRLNNDFSRPVAHGNRRYHPGRGLRNSRE